MVPAYYRDHKIPELEALKNEVRERIATASFYATDQGFELSISDERCLEGAETLRALLVRQDVQRINAEGLTPHICDMGPGEGTLPLYLQHLGLKFTYSQVYVNQPTFDQTFTRFANVWDKPKEDQIKIFVATEVIEHLHCEDEIRFEMNRTLGLADIVHISTPLYSFNPFVDDWRTIGILGHLRAYTPHELQLTVTRMFPEYSFAYYKSQVQHMRLFHPDSKFNLVKVNYRMDTSANR